MLSRFLPLEVDIGFENRPYKLGETVYVTVELTARRDVEVREGWVDLVCEVRHTEVHTVMLPVSRPRGMMGARWAPMPEPIIKLPKQVSKEYKQKYLAGTDSFLGSAQLLAGTTEKYYAKVPVPTDPPPHAAQDKGLRWRLVAVLDVVRGRDVRARRPVTIHLDLADTSQATSRQGNLPQ